MQPPRPPFFQYHARCLLHVAFRPLPVRTASFCLLLSAFCLLLPAAASRRGPRSALPSPRSQTMFSNRGNPRRYRRQRGEIGVRRRLIPVGGGKEIVAAVVGVAVLHGVFEIAFERDRVVAVPAIEIGRAHV